MKNKTLTRVFTISGFFLVVVSVLLFAVFAITQKHFAEEAKRIADQLTAAMPPVQNGFPEERTNKAMPMYIIEDESFIGILEIPAYNKSLPVAGAWDANKVFRYPCQYTGTVYEDTLVLGGSDNEGQFDFMKIITGGDCVQFTDMTGTRYTYVADRIDHTRDVSTENLLTGDFDLVLFARNTYAFDYTVVRCVLKGST